MNTQAHDVPHSDATIQLTPTQSEALLSQAKIVGAITMTLATVSLLATVVLVASYWIPAWVTTLALTAMLTALALAVFASADPQSRLRRLDLELLNARSPSAARSDHRSQELDQQTGAEHTAPVDAVPSDATPEQNDRESGEQLGASRREIEVAKFEVAVLDEDDDQEQTAVRQVELLMNRPRRLG